MIILRQTAFAMILLIVLYILKRSHLHNKTTLLENKALRRRCSVVSHTLDSKHSFNFRLHLCLGQWKKTPCLSKTQLPV